MSKVAIISAAASLMHADQGTPKSTTAVNLQSASAQRNTTATQREQGKPLGKIAVRVRHDYGADDLAVISFVT
jgi:hypothetical protein